jgi:hypothetical protein
VAEDEEFALKRGPKLHLEHPKRVQPIDVEKTVQELAQQFKK